MSDAPNPMRGWPASLVSLAELIGMAATLRLVEAYGGDGVYVPQTVDPDKPFVQIAGLTAAEILVQHYGGERLEIANLAGVRHKKPFIAEAKGTVAEVAKRFSVSARWVRYCRASIRPDDRQLEMFPRPADSATSPESGSGSA